MRGVDVEDNMISTRIISCTIQNPEQDCSGLPRRAVSQSYYELLDYYYSMHSMHSSTTLVLCIECYLYYMTEDENRSLHRVCIL